MSDPPFSEPGPSLDAFQTHAAQASATVGDLAAKGAAAASSIDAAFAKAGESLAKTLAKAASDGKVSLGELAAAAIQAVDGLARSPAGGGGASGLADALGSALGGLFAGAKADGGPVVGGGAYLVGERGPEVFRPSGAGEIAPVAGGGAVVNVTIQGGGAPAILRSEAQVAAALARAVQMGMRG